MTSTAQDRTGPSLDAPVACCRPAAGPVLDIASAERLAGVLKAVAEPTRLRLLSLVAAAQGGQACASAISPTRSGCPNPPCPTT